MDPPWSPPRVVVSVGDGDIDKAPRYWTKSDIATAAKVFDYMNAKGLAEGIPEADFTALVHSFLLAQPGDGN